ncbi:hypothetical protein TYM08_P1408 [Marinicellulosiphila megalodicopiae]
MLTRRSKVTLTFVLYFLLIDINKTPIMKYSIVERLNEINIVNKFHSFLTIGIIEYMYIAIPGIEKRPIISYPLQTDIASLHSWHLYSILKISIIFCLIVMFFYHNKDK